MGKELIVTQLAILILTNVVNGAPTNGTEVSAARPLVGIDEKFKWLAQEGLYRYWSEARSSGELHITSYMTASAEKQGDTEIKTVSFLVNGCHDFKCVVRSECNAYENIDNFTVDCQPLLYDANTEATA